MSEASNTSLHVRSGDSNILNKIADSLTKRIMVPDENACQKNKKTECKGKRKHSNSEDEAFKDSRPLIPLSSANENLIANMPKPKKARRGRPPSAKKCSSAVKKQRRARNKDWSDSDSQLSDHDMYKGTIRIIPTNRRESTKRKAATKVKYTFDTDDDESDYLSPYRNFSDKKPGNESIQEGLASEKVTEKPTEIVNKGVDAISDSLLTKPKTNNLDPVTTPCKLTSSTDADIIPSLGEVENQVSGTTKTSPHFPVVSETSSDSSTSLYIDLDISTTPDISNVPVRENKISYENSADRELESCKMKKIADPRLNRRNMVGINTKRERNRPSPNHDMETISYKDDDNDDDNDLKCCADDILPASSPAPSYKEI